MPQDSVAIAIIDSVARTAVKSSDDALLIILAVIVLSFLLVAFHRSQQS